MNKIISYAKESIAELKRVQWPSKNETMRLTAYVIGVSLGVGLFVTVFDYVFTKLLALVYL